MDRPAPGRTGSRRSPGLRPEAGCRVRELCTAARATTRGGKRGAGVRTPLSCAAAKIAFRTGAEIRAHSLTIHVEKSEISL